MKSLQELQNEYNNICMQIGNAIITMEAQAEDIKNYKEKIIELQKAAALLQTAETKEDTKPSSAA